MGSHTAQSTSQRAIDAKKKRLLGEICEELQSDSNSNTNSQILIQLFFVHEYLLILSYLSPPPI